MMGKNLFTWGAASERLIRRSFVFNFNKIRRENFSLGVVLREDEEKNRFINDGGADSKTPTASEEKGSVQRYTKEEERIIIQRIKDGDHCYPYKNEIEKVIEVTKKDFGNTGREILSLMLGFDYVDPEPFPRESDILIIGGGPIGILTAYAVKNCLPTGPKVVVLDKHEKFPPTTTNLAQATVMHHSFMDYEEILMSQYFSEFITCFSTIMEIPGKPQLQVGYEPLGSLLLANKENAEELIKKLENLESIGIYNRVLNTNELNQKFPWLNLDDTIFGVLGLTHEGLINPWAFLQAVKLKAYNLGVNFVTAEAVDIGDKGSIPRRVVCKLPDGSYDFITFSRLVVAAGIETIQFLDILNEYIQRDIGYLDIRLPLEQRRRYEYCLYNPDGPGLDTPILIDSSGVYFRREGLTGHFVAGISSIPCNDDEENGMAEVYGNKVKPFLEKRVSNFDKFELQRVWEDVYNVNAANEVGFTGRHPEEPGIYFAVGFSKFGMQYFPALARSIMELIHYGKYLTIDLSKYSVTNFYDTEEYREEKRKRIALIKSRLLYYGDE